VIAAGDNPLIVQSDRTVLLEAGHPRADACRAQLARFAELERSPEHIHTYRITPLSIWNARAAGMTAGEMVAALREFSRYPLPPAIARDIEDQANRYGRLRLERAGESLRLVATEPAILEEVVRARAVAGLLGQRLAAGAFAVPALVRGRLKQALIKLGWPAEDLAGYVEGAPLSISLRTTIDGGRNFVLRGYQVEAADAFWAGGGLGGGSGVLVLPCGAGKTVIGIASMARAATRTLILVTSIVAARQWRDELLRLTDLTPDEVGEYSGEEKTVAPVTIATYNVMTYRKRPSERSKRAFPSPPEGEGVGGGGDQTEFPHLALLGRQDWGLIVYDEVHLLPAPVFRMTAEIQSKRRLGLTATLVREDRREDDVFSLIGPKRYDAPWRDLESQGWIAPAVCTEVRVAMPADLRMAYAVAESRERYRIAACNPAKLPLMEALCAHHGADRVLVIGQYLDQLDEMAELLGAPLITGRTATAEREQLYERFRTGDLRLLVVSKVANFSIDLPEANVAIQLSGTFGSRQEEAQRLGRILRPKADGGQARFYTLVSRETSDQEYAMHRQLFLAEQGYRYEIVDEAEVTSTRAS
jgi:DNA excision repair protein ERCC-3